MKSLLTTLLLAALNFASTFAQTTSSVTDFSAAGTMSIMTLTTAMSSTESSSFGPATHTVTVGLSHRYQPDEITADPGDTVHFVFYPTNHSVVRAEFQQPCVPYDLVHPREHLFFSGNMESKSGDEPPTWDLLINDTKPQFFYCAAPGSCITSHMVGVINPSEDQTLAAQQEALKDAKFQLSPGEDVPPEQTITTLPPGQATATGTANSNSSGGGGSSLSPGSIAGIAIGGAAVVLLAIALIYFCGRKGGIEKGYRQSTMANPSALIAEAQYGSEAPKSPPMSPPYHDPYRSASPGQWSSNISQVGSPHSSYMGHTGPGMQQMGGSGPGAPLMAGQEQYHQGLHPQHSGQHPGYYGGEIPKTPEPEQPPAELPGNNISTELPPSPPSRPPHQPY